MGEFHTPVLLKEVLKALEVRPGGRYIDATVGGGGHTAEILSKKGVVLAIDADPEAINFVKRRFAAELKAQSSKLKVTKGSFRNIDEIARGDGFYPVAGIFYDLGLSSYQLEHSGRGFSFQKDEPLDMRADPALGVKAADLINALSENELFKLFKKYGEERYARRIVRAVVGARRIKPLRTTTDLSDIIVRAVWKDEGRIHPATRVFQALRIAVNDELNGLHESLPQAFRLLKPGGKLVVISFHSLEDRIVKRFARKLNLKPGLVRPSEAEIESNPRSRSARMRVIRKR